MDSLAKKCHLVPPWCHLFARGGTIKKVNVYMGLWASRCHLSTFFSKKLNGEKMGVARAALKFFSEKGQKVAPETKKTLISLGQNGGATYKTEVAPL